MRFGRFDDRRREYVISRPDTPLPWINYLGCEAYFGIISNTAGGYSFYRDARLRRITRFRYNNVPSDYGGRYIYLRDNERGEFWSPSWEPTKTKLEKYSCRHGLGYTVIGSTYKNIEASTRYFVPLGEDLEIWQVQITNHRKKTAKLSLFSSIEFCLWDAQDDSTNFQRNLNTGQVEIDDQVIYHKTEYRERRNHFAYFACSAKTSGFDTQRESFLGARRGWDNPRVVEKGRSENSMALGWSPMGSHHVKVTLQPGETKQILFLLGYHENPEEEKFDPPGSQTINKKTVKPVIAKYRNVKNVEAAFQALRTYWDDLLSIYHVETPDVHVNRMVNIWNAYQCMATFNQSRSASYFESGIGRGLGFRDSNQDLLGFVQMVPARARERIVDLAATQMKSGGAYHQYQPLTKRGNNDIGSDFNDDPLWLILGVVAYLEETNDWDILDEKVQFENEPGTESSLYEHLQRSLQYTLERLGPHGLPLIGRADWNDCLNLNCYSDTPGQSFQTTTNKDGKIAESVFIAGMFVLAAKELAGLAEKRGWSGDAQRYRMAADAMDSVVRKHGWDGEWFLRAYDNEGRKIGSKDCAEGKIFIESQGFCVMAGIGLHDGLAAKALDSVHSRLATKHGIMLNQPAFSRYYIEMGEITSYPPGYKENAGIFCHNNPWIMIAETMVGNGDRAMEYYLRINPSAREALSDRHRCEPYVYAQMIAGKDAPTHGEAKNSWLTGTAAWNYVTITQHILGIRPTHQGLRVMPVIPTQWKAFKAERKFRGVTYHIAVERAGTGNSVALLVDDKPIEGNVIPLPTPGVMELHVKAVIS
jgi:cellobiose phosphorylase